MAAGNPTAVAPNIADYFPLPRLKYPDANFPPPSLRIQAAVGFC
jgi:hypothetical protein